jgi:hypothetical protein
LPAVLPGRWADQANDAVGNREWTRIHANLIPTNASFVMAEGKLCLWLLSLIIVERDRVFSFTSMRECFQTLFVILSGALSQIGFENTP